MTHVGATRSFSLHTLFVVITLFGLGLGFLRLLGMIEFVVVAAPAAFLVTAGVLQYLNGLRTYWCAAISGVLITGISTAAIILTAWIHPERELTSMRIGDGLVPYSTQLPFAIAGVTVLFGLEILPIALVWAAINRYVLNRVQNDQNCSIAEIDCSTPPTWEL